VKSRSVVLVAFLMVGLAAVIVAGLTTETRPTPSQPSKLPPSLAPSATSAPSECDVQAAVIPGNEKGLPGREIPYFIGWRNDVVVISWKMGLCAFDPRAGSWHAIPGIPANSWRTDGTTLAGSIQDATGAVEIAFVDGTGQLTRSAAPDWYAAFLDLGNDLVPRQDGGYLFARLPQISALDEDGRLSTTSLPDGLLAMAGTSDPMRYLVRRPPQTDAPDAFVAPFEVLLWRLDTQRPEPVLDNVVAVVPASDGLARLQRQDGSWWLIEEDGTAKSTIPRLQGETTTPDTSAARVLVETDRSQGCESETPPSCRVDLRTADGITLAGVLATRQSAVSWLAGSAAFLPLSSGPSGSPTELILLGDTGSARVPLPR
jgi:hypothetical protein